MKTMRRLPTINPQQQPPGRLPQILTTSGPICKTAFGGSACSNVTYDQPYFPAIPSKPVSTSISNMFGNQSPPVVGPYRSAINQLRAQQQCAFVASLISKSSNAREQLLKQQLMKAVMKHRSDFGYLDFLRKYAEDATTTSNIQQEFDYLDYIRRDAAEDFSRNGIEVANFEDFCIADSRRSLCTAQVGDNDNTLIIATTTKDTYAKGREFTLKHVDDSAIISYGDFTTTSMSNHEPQESNFETYSTSPKASDKEYPAATAASQVNGVSRNRRNIFRNSCSHRRHRSSSVKRQESSERPRSRLGKNVLPVASAVGSRRPKRSKPYDGAPQRTGRFAGANNRHEK